MLKDIITFRVSEETYHKMVGFYQDFKLDNEGDYIVFFAKYEDITITIYESKKGYKVVMIGNNVLNEAHIWDPEAKLTEIKKKWMSSSRKDNKTPPSQ